MESTRNLKMNPWVRRGQRRVFQYARLRHRCHICGCLKWQHTMTAYFQETLEEEGQAPGLLQGRVRGMKK